jgi:hypothetical protein
LKKSRKIFNKVLSIKPQLKINGAEKIDLPDTAGMNETPLKRKSIPSFRLNISLFVCDEGEGRFRAHQQHSASCWHLHQQNKYCILFLNHVYSPKICYQTQKIN